MTRCVLCGKRIWFSRAWMRWMGAWMRVHQACYLALDEAELDYLTD